MAGAPESVLWLYPDYCVMAVVAVGDHPAGHAARPGGVGCLARPGWPARPELDLLGPDQDGDPAVIGVTGTGQLDREPAQDGLHHARAQPAAQGAVQRAGEKIDLADEVRDPASTGGCRGLRAAACAITPSRSTATRSDIDSASSWSCVTSSAVVPATRRMRRTSARTVARIDASSEANGSSSSTSRGLTARARASATRCCWPPES